MIYGLDTVYERVVTFASLSTSLHEDRRDPRDTGQPNATAHLSR